MAASPPFAFAAFAALGAAWALGSHLGSCKATARDERASNRGGAPSIGVGASVGPGHDPAFPFALEPISSNLVVDQFGYRPDGEKIAVIRSPAQGFDSGKPFSPGERYRLVAANAEHTEVARGRPVAWRGGAVDPSSGDRAWRFDFTSVTAPGAYYVLDDERGVRSPVFRIAPDVYRDVLVQSLRMFYYQRDGIAKEARYAGASWADGPAHMGPGQGPDCRSYSGQGRRDVHGGWFDAGDQNKYTNFGAADVIELLRAYRENPSAFSDDENIPESGNGLPDVLDEAKWELDWLERMQGDDGAVLSIVGQDAARSPEIGGSPDTAPSRARGPCTYGPATTSATLSTAAAFAFASMTFASIGRSGPAHASDASYADELSARARIAWTWAVANPHVAFKNAGRIGGGEQEVEEAGLLVKALQAAAFLFELTGDPAYRDFFDGHVAESRFVRSGTVDLFASEEQDALLEYTRARGASPDLARRILSKYEAGAASDDNLAALRGDRDPYFAFMRVYTWGSNWDKARQGNVFADLVAFGMTPAVRDEALRAAERYLHYLHGLNPLGLVYLSNMGAHGAHKSVTRLFHTWFARGSYWDAVGESKYGPPPGFLVGGPNPAYGWDACCPARCSGRLCGAAPPSPPAGQPDQKSYRDFNDGWPLDSWSVSEPDDGYQAAYVRLLSKFVR